MDTKLCEHCGTQFHRGERQKWDFNKLRFCSKRCSGLRPNSGQRKAGETPWNKGKKCPQLILPPESRAKKSASLKAVGAGKWRKGMEPWNKGRANPHSTGPKNPNWKGGITVKTRGLRWSAQYARWRTKVFERDDYICRFCGQRGGRLNADHIKPLLHHPELIFDLNNGRTLCENCHKQTDTYGTKAKKWKEEICV